MIEAMLMGVARTNCWTLADPSVTAARTASGTSWLVRCGTTVPYATGRSAGSGITCR